MGLFLAARIVGSTWLFHFQKKFYKFVCTAELLRVVRTESWKLYETFIFRCWSCSLAWICGIKS